MAIEDVLTEDRPLTPAVFRRVEGFLYRVPRYRAILARYEQDRADVLDRARQWEPRPGDRTEGSVSDPTADKVAQLERIERRADEARAAVALVEAVWEILSDEEREIVDLKYWDRAPRTNQQVADELAIGRTTFYRRRQAIVEKFADVAGWI